MRKHDRFIHARVPQQVLEDLEQVASVQERTLSDVIRRILQTGLAAS